MSSVVPSMGQTVMALAAIGFLFTGQWWLAYALFSVLEGPWGAPAAAAAAALLCLAFVALLAFLVRQPAQARGGGGDPELEVIAALAARRPFLGVGLSAVLGAVRAAEQSRR